MPDLPLQPGSLPAGYCYPASVQTLYNDMFSLGVAVMNTTLTGVLLQEAAPPASDSDKVWVRVSGGAPVFPSVWVFHNGHWIARHPIPASDKRVHVFTGNSSDVDTLDGGAAGAVSDDAGPFWTIDSTFEYRMPVGVGTLPVAGTALAVGNTGGLDQHTLSIDNIPAHRHSITAERNVDINATSTRTIAGKDGMAGEFQSSMDTGSVGGGQPITNMPPYRVVYFIKRTARIYCTAPIA